MFVYSDLDMCTNPEGQISGIRSGEGTAAFGKVSSHATDD